MATASRRCAVRSPSISVLFFMAFILSSGLLLVMTLAPASRRDLMTAALVTDGSAPTLNESWPSLPRISRMFENS